MSHSPWNEMAYQPFDMTSRGRLPKHSGQRVDNKFEQKRGHRVTLPESVLVPEEVPYLSIHRDCSLASRDQLHNAVYPNRRETTANKHLTQEIPIYPVIGLFEV